MTKHQPNRHRSRRPAPSAHYRCPVGLPGELRRVVGAHITIELACVPEKSPRPERTSRNRVTAKIERASDSRRMVARRRDGRPAL
jgi:hypothetical protein